MAGGLTKCVKSAPNGDRDPAYGAFASASVEPDLSQLVTAAFGSAHCQKMDRLWRDRPGMVRALGVFRLRRCKMSIAGLAECAGWQAGQGRAGDMGLQRLGAASADREFVTGGQRDADNATTGPGTGFDLGRSHQM